MKKIIEVRAEKVYDVLITDNWREELAQIAASRTRCAVILTQSTQDRIGILEAAVDRKSVV